MEGENYDLEGLRIMYYGEITPEKFGNVNNLLYLCNYCELNGRAES